MASPTDTQQQEQLPKTQPKFPHPKHSYHQPAPHTPAPHPSGLQVIVAGAGIGGLMTSILLERAGINHVLLERATTFKPLGAALTLSAQTVRMFDQLGLLKELHACSKFVSGMTFYRQDLSPIARTPLEHFNERYGYASLGMSRPEFMTFLLKQVVPHRIHWGKRVLNTMQNVHGVMVRCQDGTTYHGDILIGADGAYSAVRQSLYKNLSKKGVKLSKNDLSPLRFEMFCNVGVAKNLDPAKFTKLKEEWVELEAILANDQPITIWTIPCQNNRMAWVAGGKLVAPRVSEGEESVRLSDWETRTEEDLSKQLRGIKLTQGENVTVGDLIDSTEPELISRVLLEDKLFYTWFEGRTVLLGDAVHKLLPFGGQGATQAILDSIALVDLLSAIPSKQPAVIKQAFKSYYSYRFPSAKAAYKSSAMASKLSGNRGMFADMSRSLALKHMPQSVVRMMMDKLHMERPIVSFMEPPGQCGIVMPNAPMATDIYDSAKNEPELEKSETVAV
ncbi:hypothetical protein DFQ27_007671 [Actinomortierella ambigua]|uniref:FAD-binding domain-containing protein n=1 Tax=Actinomortierella ambigua TaxID=1343610 RepID=A0A9P6QGA6_9FUNG|nr:hypothetical protein DFQ27_007671 [Actinomortierella ambigua]